METTQCTWTVETKVSRGILGKGTESFTTRPRQCSRHAVEGELCAQHAGILAHMRAVNEARRAAR